MLVMAIEAIKQSTKAVYNYTGFKLKEVFFQTPLVIPLTREGIDIQFTLLSTPRNSDKSISWSEFRIYSLSNDDWILNCRGSIQPEFEDLELAIDNGRELFERNSAYDLLYKTKAQKCNRTVDSGQIYPYFEASGLQYGPAFQRLEKVSYNEEGDALGSLSLFKWIVDRDSNHMQSHVIHPASLDGALQMSYIAMSRGGTKDIPTMVPTRIHNLWVSNDNLSYPLAESIIVYAQSPDSSQNGGLVVGLDSNTKQPLIVADGVEATVVGNKNDSRSDSKKLCYSIDWKPDFSILSPKRQIEYCESGNQYAPEPIEFYQSLQFMIIAYVTNTLKLVEKQKLEKLDPHFRSYFSWMELQSERFNKGTLPGSLPQWPALLEDIEYQNTLSTQLGDENFIGKTYIEVGRQLVDILHGTADPLAILFQTTLAKDYYEEISNSVRYLVPMKRYLKTLIHKHPSMKILEIGGGTGGMTRHVLNYLMEPKENGEFETPLYSSYDFTDISRSFFMEVQAKFAHHGSRLNFGILNIDEEPQQQGFNDGVYDMVLAASVSRITQEYNGVHPAD